MISIKNLTLLLAVLLMGLCLISSVSAMDIDDSDLLSASDDVSDSSISTVPSSSDSSSIGSVDGGSSDSSSSNSVDSLSSVESTEDGAADTISNIESDTGSSNVNSENEVLSTDYTVEDSDLNIDSNNKNSNNVLTASAVQASAKTKTTLKASSSTVYVGDQFSVTLKTSSGKALANQKVNIKISGKTYTKTTNSNGVASLTINLLGTKYPVVCSFAGTSAYSASSLSLTLNVNKRPTTLKANSNSIYRGNEFSVTLKDNNGKALSSQKVGITIDGKTYNKTTNSNGVASLTINLAGSKYAVVCSFGGTSLYNASKVSTTLSVAKNPNAFTISEIETAASSVKAYVLKNNKLPTTVTVGSKTLKISEFSYLAGKAISNLNSKNKKDILLISGISNCNSSTHSLNTTVYTDQYVDLAKRVVSYIESKKVPPSYAAVKNTAGKSVGNANFNLYTFAFAKILVFHKSDKYLPYYCTFESAVIKTTTSLKSTTIKASSTSLTRGDYYTITLSDSSGKALSNQKVTFTINGKSYAKTTNDKGSASLQINLVQGKYSIVCSYGGSSTYKASKLSNTISTKNSTSRFYISDIEVAANNVKKYVTSHNALPKTVTVANVKLDISQFSYLMSKAVSNINAGNNKYITLTSGIKNGNSSGSKINSKVYKAQYIDLAKRVNSYVESNKVPPVYAKVYSSSGSSLGNAEFDLYTFAFAKILVFHKSDKYLPNYCTFESSVLDDSVVPAANMSDKIKYNSSQFKNGLNEKNTESNLTKYLIGTGQSKITDSIKNLAAKLTKGLTSNDAKALSIYNYVRDEISYSYYADSKYGAAGTLSAGQGNCVDQASLVVALCRAANIPARYSHAQGCTFSSGLVTGHVWAQVYVNGVWYSADATSVRNQLGNIVNWNTNSYYSLKKYAAVPF